MHRRPYRLTRDGRKTQLQQKTIDVGRLLGVWFDQKLNWKTHISSVQNHCLNLKKLFSIIANTKFGPPVKVLILLFKTLVRSKIDYGLIAYGNANKSNLEKIDIVSRATL